MKAMEEIVEFLGEFCGDKVACLSKSTDLLKSSKDCFHFQSRDKLPTCNDFFDSLSCDSLAGGPRNGRTRFSEQMTRDTEDENCNMECERVGSDVKFPALKKLKRDHRVEMVLIQELKKSNISIEFV
ncbi:hypothetical protein V6N13_068776 [Hibiscus sabdariffa]